MPKPGYTNLMLGWFSEGQLSSITMSELDPANAE